MTEGAHQLAFLHELSHRLADFPFGNLRAVEKDLVDPFSCADGPGYGDLVDAAVGSSAYSSASESHVREHERSQLRVLTEKIGSHYFKPCLFAIKGESFDRKHSWYVEPSPAPPLFSFCACVECAGAGPDRTITRAVDSGE